MSDKNTHLYTSLYSSHLDDEPISTVVTDRWELPHSCLKTGRVIGSGAFGQVVKGRVSRSILVHRGIDLVESAQTASTHLTVAIKMLQGKSLFLKERFSLFLLN